MTVPVITSPILSVLSHVHHAFFTRQGGTSQGAFDSLNTGHYKGDDVEAVEENRRRICYKFGLDRDCLRLLRQEHTDIVHVTGMHSTGIPTGDGHVATVSGVLLGIQTADCVPLLFADRNRPIIGAVHAGWRGAVGGVIENTIKTMVDQGSIVKDIVVAIGPCIWQDSYEVSADFYEALKDHAEFFKPGKRVGHYQFDLPGYVSNRLRLAGVESICPSPADTFANEDRFFSFRRKTLRQDAHFGCQVAVIAIKD
ncbi:MAG: peptidoglycan editing factor PgeF [Alphaproteobacteria bacterium]|nr:peptidoglycan editing factor PgeF [Alphaproteobacteria bacterium]